MSGLLRSWPVLRSLEQLLITLYRANIENIEIYTGTQILVNERYSGCGMTRLLEVNIFFLLLWRNISIDFFEVNQARSVYHLRHVVTHFEEA